MKLCFVQFMIFYVNFLYQLVAVSAMAWFPHYLANSAATSASPQCHRPHGMNILILCQLLLQLCAIDACCDVKMLCISGQFYSLTAANSSASHGPSTPPAMPLGERQCSYSRSGRRLTKGRRDEQGGCFFPSKGDSFVLMKDVTSDYLWCLCKICYLKVLVFCFGTKFYLVCWLLLWRRVYG